MTFRATLQILTMVFAFFLASPLHAEVTAEKESSFTTIWPLLDYRKTASGDLRSLSLLGPIFRLKQQDQQREVALRPLFLHSEQINPVSSETTVLYPLASRSSGPELIDTQILKLYHTRSEPTEDGALTKDSFMLFPFVISGTSDKYGPYFSLFPLYGDIYERFWRDEYHFVLFPLYSRTVKGGATSTNILYPFFSILSGEHESGFQFWPLYGQSSKEGEYRKKFALWPVFSQGTTSLNTDKQLDYLYILPLYAEVNSPTHRERHYAWPFFGHTVDTEQKQETWDYLWPLFVVSRGEQKTVDRYLPFYMSEKRKDSTKEWYLWPLYRHESTVSPSFEEESHRVFYYLFSSYRDKLPEIGYEKERMAFWPLFLYRTETGGFSRLTLPAPIEPIVDRDGIENLWAPLWRIYQQTWNEKGDSALSIAWNLFWREKSGNDLAYELFPLFSYKREGGHVDVRFLKGLFSYDEQDSKREILFFRLPVTTWEISPEADDKAQQH